MTLLHAMWPLSSHFSRRVATTAAALAVVASSVSAQPAVTYEVLADLGAMPAVVPPVNPASTLVRAPGGQFYATTQDGGGNALQCGTIFRFDLPATLSLLHVFDNPLGCDPSGDLVLGSDGSLFGTTYLGGAHGGGTLYRLPPSGPLEVLHHFQATSDPSRRAIWPWGGVVLAPNGYLYGTTISGAVYRIRTDGAGYEELYAPGGLVYAGLTLASDGLLYGAAAGAPGCEAGCFFRGGLVGGFERIYTLPWTDLDFPSPDDAPEGSSPMGNVVEIAGELFGTNRLDGPFAPGTGSGTVFKLSQPGGAWSLALLHAFPPDPNAAYPEGREPEPGLTRGSDGYLYGIARVGGTGLNGLIYRVSAEGAYEALHTFTVGAGSTVWNARLVETSPGVFLGLLQSAIFRLTVPVPPPQAHDQDLATDEDTVAGGTLVATGGSPLTYAIASNGTLGAAVITDTSTGAFAYTPNANTNGTDTFTFTATAGTLSSNVATVTVTIAPVNDAPVVSNGTLSATAGTVATGALQANDVDSTALTFAIATNGSQGTAVITDAATGAYSYTPNAAASGTDLFTFTASDGSAVSNAATVTVTIAAGSNAPVASDGAIATAEDRAARGTLVATDPNGDRLTYAVVTNGTKGTVTIARPMSGRFRYVPNANASGADTFTFRASDGSTTSNTATVTVTITPVNDAPVASDGAFTTTSGTPVSGVLAAIDVDGDTLAFAIARQPRSGTVTLGDGGAFTYAPRAGFRGTDSFQFRASDGQATSARATVTVTVQ